MRLGVGNLPLHGWLLTRSPVRLDPAAKTRRAPVVVTGVLVTLVGDPSSRGGQAEIITLMLRGNAWPVCSRRCANLRTGDAAEVHRHRVGVLPAVVVFDQQIDVVRLRRERCLL